jgi:hypothetical protein
MNPVGYHLTNLLLHTLGAMLLAVLTANLLRRATAWDARAITAGATVAALVFAVHPLRVESVAWATERRDVLSIAMAPPVVLLALDAYPLRRAHEGWARLVREKPPFLAPTALSAIAAFHAVAGALSDLPVHQGRHLVTDRYSYLPSLAWARLAGAGAGWPVAAAGRKVVSAAVGRFAAAAVAMSVAASRSCRGGRPRYGTIRTRHGVIPSPSIPSAPRVTAISARIT